ncbi:hypothetical protein O9K51_00240 [Purpureocillium lavendulum]|uniref:Enterotoxin n=1 Tax=Purpureocillium lavendulum TaxID=1247861 RepID=A0AB34G1T5_9HYPO|nr:hypothetical protein O9K51_00240 [Purpureocillium lavendulum]
MSTEPSNGEPRRQVFWYNDHNYQRLIQFSVPTAFDGLDIPLPVIHPAYYRQQGGIQYFTNSFRRPTRLPVWATDDLAFRQSRIFMGGRASFIYRIVASPNIISGPVNAVGQESEISYAIGAILWSQVQSYAATTGEEVAASELIWVANPDFDPRWLNYTYSPPQPLITGGPGWQEQRERLQGRVILSPERLFMDELTSLRNPALNPASLQTLRDLLDWDNQRDPSRDFPLLRRFYVPTLASWALMSIDWRAVDGLTGAQQMTLRGGIPGPALCLQGIRRLSEMNYVPDGPAEDDPSQACTTLAKTATNLKRKHSSEQDDLEARTQVCESKRARAEEVLERLEDSRGNTNQSAVAMSFQDMVCLLGTDICKDIVTISMLRNKPDVVLDNLSEWIDLPQTVCADDQDRCRERVAQAFRHASQERDGNSADRDLRDNLAREADMVRHNCVGVARAVGQVDQQPDQNDTVPLVQWNGFVEHEEARGVSLEQLVEVINQGPDWFSANDDATWTAMRDMYPEVFDTMWEAYLNGFSPLSCHEPSPRGRESPARRSAPAMGPPRGDPRWQVRKDVCKRLNALVYQKPSILFCGPTKPWPRCINTEAPPGQCVTVPSWVVDVGGTSQPNVEAGDCDVYSNSGCIGEPSLVGLHGREARRIKLRYPFSSIRCTGNTTLSLQECPVVNKLTITLKLGGWLSGTWDAVLAGLGSSTLVPLVDGPSGSYEDKQVAMERYSHYQSNDLERPYAEDMAEVWKGSIDPRDWRIVDDGPAAQAPSTKGKQQTRVELGEKGNSGQSRIGKDEHR